jgi:hypothetical protein
LIVTEGCSPATAVKARAARRRNRCMVQVAAQLTRENQTLISRGRTLRLRAAAVGHLRERTCPTITRGISRQNICKQSRITVTMTLLRPCNAAAFTASCYILHRCGLGGTQEIQMTLAALGADVSSDSGIHVVGGIINRPLDFSW